MEQPPLIEKREVLEMQDIATLLGWKALMLAKMSELESEVHLVNDVLDGLGYESEWKHNAGTN